MASLPLKCHLCGSYLQECAPIWRLDGRSLHDYRCLDRKCAAIRVDSRCTLGVIIPDSEIVSYQLLVRYREQWWRIWARKNSEYPSDTTLYKMDVGHPKATGKETRIFNLPRYYEISTQDNLESKTQEILEKFKRLVAFI